jgi:hypothetical protein
MWMHELPFDAAQPGSRRFRNFAATLLRAASRRLDSLANRLALAGSQPHGDPVVEFYAEAGAPEGALFINGELVGRLVGVNRL